MKLPFDFGIRFVLRLVAPGALLSGIFLPLVREVAGVIYPGLGDAVLYIAFGLVFGFALLLLDMPIYMLLEGRRFWPGPIRRWAIDRQQARLRRIVAKANAADKSRQVELDIQAYRYPIDPASGTPHAPYPTRLGNLLASFETYPTVKYGLDGVFYWPRLWVSIDKDLREELDSAQAVVDGAIYLVFAFGVSTFVCLFYWWWIPSQVWWHWPAAALACLALAWLLKALALSRYAQYGELFAATFDQCRDKLVISDALLADLDTKMGAPSGTSRTDREKAQASWRFLRWHRYRQPGASGNQTVVGL